MGCNSSKNFVQPLGRPNSATHSLKMTPRAVYDDNTDQVINPERVSPHNLSPSLSSSSTRTVETNRQSPPSPGRPASRNHKAKRDEQLFADHILQEHNKYRKDHGVGDLTLNSEISEIAERWARHLVDIGKMEHSSTELRSYRGSSLGENLAFQYSSDGRYTGMESVQMWYDEIEMYDYTKTTWQKGCGHFTQVIWKESQELGVGRASTDDGRVFVVCNYFPAGNVLGYFKENVPRKH